MITVDEVMKVIGAAHRKAAAIGQPMNLAVPAGGGNLVAQRMDGAWIGSIDVSIKNPFMARAFDIPTKDLAPWLTPMDA
jgi:uncharacterized protein GlcG (DUF336 family)